MKRYAKTSLEAFGLLGEVFALELGVFGRLVVVYSHRTMGRTRVGLRLEVPQGGGSPVASVKIERVNSADQPTAAELTAWYDAEAGWSNVESVKKNKRRRQTPERRQGSDARPVETAYVIREFALLLGAALFQDGFTHREAMAFRDWEDMTEDAVRIDVKTFLKKSIFEARRTPPKGQHRILFHPSVDLVCPRLDKEKESLRSWLLLTDTLPDDGKPDAPTPFRITVSHYWAYHLDNRAKARRLYGAFYLDVEGSSPRVTAGRVYVIDKEHGDSRRGSWTSAIAGYSQEGELVIVFKVNDAAGAPYPSTRHYGVFQLHPDGDELIGTSFDDVGNATILNAWSIDASTIDEAILRAKEGAYLRFP